MLARRRQTWDALGISALDIFASALGVFVLMAILLFPFYLKQPSLEVEIAGAEADLAAAQRAHADAGQLLAAATARRADAEDALAIAQARLAEQAAAAIAAAPPAAETTAGEQPVPLSIADLDLVFVMDTTGSMREELANLQASLVGIVRVLSRLAASLRVGFVAYKDRGEAYLTRVFPLQTMDRANARALVAFVRELTAEGGGDDPEPVDEALERALAMPWRAAAQGRIIVIGDAKVHDRNRQRALDMAARFRRAGPEHPRSVAAIFAGDDAGHRRFFEQLASAGGGEVMQHQEQMIESVLLSVLPPRGAP